jgi:UDP-glucose:(heptosyl)LPS alpha-1,3-glucosyltransferase
VKILIVARPFSFHGGVETATAGLVRALVDHGHDVHVLSPGPQAAVRGVTVHRVRVPPLPAAPRALAFATLVKIATRRGRWDVVQSHERTVGQDVYRAGEGCHRAYLDARERVDGRRGYHRVMLALERRVLTRTPRIVAIARRGKTEIERLYGVPSERIEVVYNGVDLDRFHPKNRSLHRAKARSEAGIPDDAWVTLFVGSGFERKGLATAIAAFALVDDRRSRLVVIGRGDDRQYRALAERSEVGARVAWLGPRPDIERWYAAADALVLPARYEPFGNVHLEALASGIPVATSTAAGGAEVVREGKSGFVRQAQDVAGFADALEQLRLGSGNDSIEAARRSAEPFTYAKQVSALEVIYRRFARNT